MRPHATQTIELALAEAWDTDIGDARRQVWRNLGDLLDETDERLVLPRGFEIALAAA